MTLTPEDRQILIDLLKKEIKSIDEQIASLHTDIKHLRIAKLAKEAGYVIIQE